MSRRKQVKVKDEELVRLYLKGDERAFEELWARYERQCGALCFKFLRNIPDCQDALQDLALTLTRKLKTFNGASAFSSWMYRVTANAALMHLRKNKNWRRIDFKGLAYHCECKSPDNPELKIRAKRQARCIVKTIDRMRKPEMYKQVFYLKRIEGMTSRDVSAMMGETLPAIKSRYRRALEAYLKVTNLVDWEFKELAA